MHHQHLLPRVQAGAFEEFARRGAVKPNHLGEGPGHPARRRADRGWVAGVSCRQPTWLAGQIMCYARGGDYLVDQSYRGDPHMKLGLGLPHHGVEATPQRIVEFAQRAEALGFDSLWVFERLLRALEPAEGGRTPECYANVFAPVETLTYVAAHTSTIRLGTSVIAALFHVPVLLGRRLATLDHLSAGRLVVGLGQGWSADEFATANVPMRRRGSGFEEFIEALRATWGPDPISYQGRFYRIAASQVSPTPPQPGGPPILIAAAPGVDASVQRAGRLGLGLNPGVS